MSRAIAVFGAALLAAGCTLAAPLLAGPAFTRPAVCDVEPFDDAEFEQRAEQLGRDCGRERLRLQVPMPRLVSSGGSGLELQLGHVVTRPVGLAAGARLGWSGAAEPNFGSGRSLLAAGGVLRLDDQWAIDFKAGRDAGRPRSRGAVAGLWRPGDDHLVFLQFAAEREGIANTLGLRWWLKPGQAAIELAAHRSPVRDSIEPRFAVQLYGFAR